jgi:hypothetical protein
MLMLRTGLSILFVSYILAQVPSNLLLNHLGRPSLYLGFFVCAWGLVSALTCLVTNFAGIVVCRLFLGFMEAPFFPGGYRCPHSLPTLKLTCFRCPILPEQMVHEVRAQPSNVDLLFRLSHQRCIR